MKNFKKPKNTEIKKIGKYWYLYERSTKYDPVTKKSKKVSGKMLGKITEEGFIKKKIKAEKLLEIETLEFGASSYFSTEYQEILKRLKIYFPVYYKEIFVLSIIRLVYGAAFKRIGTHYETSYLKKLFPNIALSSSSISRLLDYLGKNRTSIKDYMNSFDRKEKRFILFDGHKIISESKNLEISDKGYDSKKRYKDQCNLIYIFSLEGDNYYPEFYKNFNGSIPDITAFNDILKESKIKKEKSIIIADKGFHSIENVGLIDELDVEYIMPLKRGNKEIKENVPSSTTEYDAVFQFNKRTIYSKTFYGEDYNCHLFLDTKLLNDEISSLVDRTEKSNILIEKSIRKEQKRREKGKGKLTDDELNSFKIVDAMDVIQKAKETGTITLKTNTKLEAKEVYEVYKKRQAIEQFFKMYDNELGFSKSYMRTDYSLEGWLFLNHISITMGIDLINKIDKQQKTKDISLRDAITLLKKIKTSKIDNKFYINKIPKKTRILLEALDINLEC